ncbi:P-loop NTPase fold protein [Sedimentibacter sp. B4]|uniref:P-loop NTPase fold protein n=1 Tax=Sedimentibacter sp. B4 TaxID=304766 RepID=UPI0002E43CAA|nr:P-loop NTPase fold protein [Sedimentibacter sp. B4]
MENELLNYMSGNEIIDYVNNYINKSNYNYAVLIDGSWGSGKTYFIKNSLIPALEANEKSRKSQNGKPDNKKIIYISLYGISSKEELDFQILLEVMPFKSFFNRKNIKLASNIGKAVISGVSSFYGILLPKKIIDFSDISSKNYILIFDDLERCNMNVNNLLGYINNYVEHDGIKTIIISNEKEIASTNMDLNRELKYLVALNNDLVLNDSKNESDVSVDLFGDEKHEDNNEKVNVDELLNKINIIFGQDNLYKKIKEKLVGVTLYYKPDFNKIIETVTVNSINDEKIKNIIIYNKAYIIEKLNYYNHQNIRTILFCLDKYNNITENLIKALGFTRLEKLLDDMFKYTLVISILYKTGQDLPKWESNNEIMDVVVSKNIYNFNSYIKGFKFIDNYIKGATFNKEKAIEVIKRYNELENKQINDPNDPLFILNNNWWLIEDEEVLELINEINETLKCDPNKYNITVYLNIITLNIKFNRLGIQSKDIKEIMDLMKNNMKELKPEKNDSFDVFGWSSSDFETKEDSKLFTECANELNNYLNDVNNETIIDKLNYFLNNQETWSKSVDEFIQDKEMMLIDKRAFISLFDFESLVKSIKNARNNQIIEFRVALRKIYNFANIKDYYLDEKEYVDKLIGELKKYSLQLVYNQKIKNNNLKYLIKDLEEILGKLS